MTTRKTFLAVAIAALVFSTNVSAFGNGGQGGAGGQGGSASNRSTTFNTNANSNRQGQGQRQGQRQSNRQGQGQGQAQGNVGLGSGNDTSLVQSYTEDYSETYDDYTPSAYAPSMGVSAPCKVGFGAGGGVPGISLSGGGYTTDEDCVVAESIRMGLQSGNAGNISLANQLLENRLQLALDEMEPTVAEVKTAAAAEGRMFTDDVASTTGNYFLDSMH